MICKKLKNNTYFINPFLAENVATISRLHQEVKTRGHFNLIVMLVVLHVELIMDTSNSIYIITDDISERSPHSLTPFQTF